MKIINYGIVILVCTFISGCAGSPKSKGLSDEQFFYAVPKGWVLGFSERQGNMLMKEFVPEGETVENWNEMLTTQIFYGGVNQSPDAFASGMRRLWKKHCPRSLVSLGKSGKENGYSFEFWQQICNKNPKTNRPEVTFIKAIEGNDSFYVVQKAWKRLPTDEEIRNWSKNLRYAHVCDSRIPERKCSAIR